MAYVLQKAAEEVTERALVPYVKISTWIPYNIIFPVVLTIVSVILKKHNDLKY